VPTAQWNLAEPGQGREPADGGLAAFLAETGWVLTTDEWRQAPERYRDLAMPDWLAELPRAWVVVPLFHHEQLTGFVVLTRSRAAGRDLNWEDCDLLKTIGRQAATFLAQEDAAEALGRAQQFETFNRLSAFVLHDLKNIIGQLSMLARNAHRNKDNPAFMADAVKTLDHSVARMNHLMAQLRGGVQSPKVEKVDLAQVVREAVEARHGRGPSPAVELPGEALTLHADRARLGAVIGHVVQNAREATPETGEVRIQLSRDGDGAVLDIVDSGEGMSPGFVRDRLFKPFDTSKGSTGMGIGAFEAREYARELGGEVEVASSPGAGTRFRFRFPAETAEPVPMAKEASN
jgi:putative PEP-CTERM system histidine kinase